MNRLRLLVVDAHEVVRRGLRVLLERSEQFEIIGEAADALSATAAAERLQPDLVLMDLTLGGACALPLINRLKLSCPDVRLLAFTEHDEEGFVRSALDGGVAGYVLKQSPPSVLRDALAHIARGGTYVDPQLTWLCHPGRAGAASIALSEREREVVGLVALGYTSKEIASLIHVSVKSVETYRYRAVGKLGLRNRSDLVRYALYRGWMLETRNVA